MSFLKAITIITLWMILSFVWVSMGQSKAKECFNYGEAESWLTAYPVVEDWFHFYVGQNSCEVKTEEFFKTLASSEPLSTKLNQARVKFDQFYIPLSHLLEIRWGSVQEKEAQNIQSDLTSIDHSLRKVLQEMTLADRDFFRSIILLGIPSEFGQALPAAEGKRIWLSRRINRGAEKIGRDRIHPGDVNPLPVEPAYR